ncbi:MAG: hypothetical protein WCQ16_03790, partial [Verrucomicrobiae bacterium]
PASAKRLRNAGRIFFTGSGWLENRHVINLESFKFALLDMSVQKRSRRARDAEHKTARGEGGAERFGRRWWSPCTTGLLRTTTAQIGAADCSAASQFGMIEQGDKENVEGGIKPFVVFNTAQI